MGDIKWIKVVLKLTFLFLFWKPTLEFIDEGRLQMDIGNLIVLWFIYVTFSTEENKKKTKHIVPVNMTQSDTFKNRLVQ